MYVLVNLDRRSG